MVVWYHHIVLRNEAGKEKSIYYCCCLSSYVTTATKTIIHVHRGIAPCMHSWCAGKHTHSILFLLNIPLLMIQIERFLALVTLALLRKHGVEGFGSVRTGITLSPPSLSSLHSTSLFPATSSLLSSKFHHPRDRKLTQPCAQTSSSSDSGTLEKRKWRRLAPPLPLTSTAILIALDVAFRRGFQRAKIQFPSSLAGCGVILVALFAAHQIKSDKNDSSALYRQLQPGASLLAQWLPVFFVPSLVSLPLAAGLGSAMDLFKVSLVLVGGFLFSLLTTAYAVETVRQRKESSDIESTAAGAVTGPKDDDTDDATVDDPVNTITKSTEKPTAIANNDDKQTSSKPFSGKLLSQLTLTATTTGLLAALGFVGSQASQFLTSVCFLSSTLATFVFGARLPRAFVKLVHPLVTCTTLTWSVVALLATLTGHTFRGMLRAYKTGSVWTGAGDVLLFLLGPAVVSLAVSIFDRRRLVRNNAKAVGTAVGVATAGGVGVTALAVRLLDIGIPSVRLSLLSRNITSPLAMAMANILGADASLAVSMVVITGLIGANFGAVILSAFGIKDPVARGLSMGAAAHGLGTAALAGSEPDAFSFSAIAMALVASAATVTVSIPFLRRIVLEVALG